MGAQQREVAAFSHDAPEPTRVALVHVDESEHPKQALGRPGLRCKSFAYLRNDDWATTDVSVHV